MRTELGAPAGGDILVAGETCATPRERASGPRRLELAGHVELLRFVAFSMPYRRLRGRTGASGGGAPTRRRDADSSPAAMG
jgi:hypothetical protein